jgi:hypothetical protein
MKIDPDNTFSFIFNFATLLLIIAIFIGQKPIEIEPCEKYGKTSDKVTLIEKNRIIYMCKEAKK